MEKKSFIEDNIGFVELLEVFGDDLTVSNAARVSFNKESHLEPVSDPDGNIVGYQTSERDKKLINYLADHHHITPFFHPILRFRLRMPLFVARQWFKHTVGFARNEVSRRYVDEKPEIFTPSILRQRDKNLKQGSKDNAAPENDTLVATMQAYNEQALAYYEQLLTQDVAPEQARIVLPQSTYTEFIETGSLSAYARLVTLRTDSGAQKEIRLYAELVSTLIQPHFPVSWDALITKHTKVEEV